MVKGMVWWARIETDRISESSLNDWLRIARHGDQDGQVLNMCRFFEFIISALY